jgi:hypothetical protein
MGGEAWDNDPGTISYTDYLEGILNQSGEDGYWGYSWIQAWAWFFGSARSSYTFTPAPDNTASATTGFRDFPGAVPNYDGAPAFFPNYASASTLSIGTSSVIWGALVIDSAGTVSITGTGTVTFENDNGVLINVNQGTHTISNPVAFASSGSNTFGTISLNSSSALAFTGRVTGDSSFTLDQEGQGTAIFTNLNIGTYLVNSGTLNIADPNGGAATATIGQLLSPNLNGAVNIGGGSGPVTFSASRVSVATLNIGAAGSGNVNATIGILSSPISTGVTSSGSLDGSGAENVTGLPAPSIGVVNVGGGSGSAVLTVTQLAVPALSIGSSGSVVIAAGGGTAGTGSISSLTIASGGQLDITDHGLVIEYGPNPQYAPGGTASLVGDLILPGTGSITFLRTAHTYPSGSIQGYVQTAFDSYNWDGPGITSSAAANDPTGLTAVGVADENDLDIVYPNDYTVAGGGTGTWLGQPINDTNNVLVRYTYYGDGNLDGVVNDEDVSALSLGYSGLAGYIGWSDGDYTYDGRINENDISLLAVSYVWQGAPLGDAITPGQARYLLALDHDMPATAAAYFQAIAAGETPEPASVAFLGAASIGLLRRRAMRR